MVRTLSEVMVFRLRFRLQSAAKYLNDCQTNSTVRSLKGMVGAAQLLLEDLDDISCRARDLGDINWESLPPKVQKHLLEGVIHDMD